MNNKTYNVFNLLLNHVMGYILGIFRKNKNIRILKHIGIYSYVKVIQQEKGQDTVVALYQDKNNNKAVAKIWQGRYKNYSYYSLKNEYMSYIALHKIINRTRKIVPKELATIKIPKLLYFNESSSDATLLIEWADGTVGTDISNKKLLSSYKLINLYLDFLSLQAKPSELKFISKRSGLHYLLLYPLTLANALIKHPEYSGSLLLGLVKVFPSVTNFLQRSNLTLVHRDLNFENILIGDKSIYLIDFQFLTLTYKASEFVNILRYCWDKNRLKDEIYDLMISNYGNEYSVKHLFRPLSIVHATHGLISSHFSNSVNGKIAKFLRSAL